MDLQDENILLGKRIAKLENELTFTKRNLFDALIDNDSLRDEIHELEEQEKEQQEFPKVGEYYFYIGDTGDIYRTEYAPPYNDDDYECRKGIGNIFKNREQACFTVEKLKVEEELRKFGRPFKEDEYNHYIFLDTGSDCLDVDYLSYCQSQGTIHFESEETAREAIKSVGEERIKKYIFGVED